jgi:hypothetical protein
MTVQFSLAVSQYGVGAAEKQVLFLPAVVAFK